ncbi:beta-1,4-mannosyltransferase egh-like [Brevipalpus obovatus]|uniref:beta-1,4-mannosyltransferase egh-like n=1 Tax=Brevipalpus obovatus TaxID=246614 RepID=UPI003D9E7294
MMRKSRKTSSTISTENCPKKRVNRWFRLSPTCKHLLHCVAMLATIAFFMREYTRSKEGIISEPYKNYGKCYKILVYLLRLAPLLQLPHGLFNFLGLFLYNAFNDEVSLKYSLSGAPFLCFRIVTKGYFPDLVRGNVQKNLKICHAVGLEKFVIEVVTEKYIENLLEHPKIKQTVVPPDYQTKNGTLFKARVLQYSLEDDVIFLGNKDYIVHLDEETLLTENSVRGIINFVIEGKHAFGQGLVTYASGEIVNWMNTLLDSICVADDMGKVQFQFRMFHKPLFGWKGSFMVARFEAERSVTFDHGLDGSITEDNFFAMKAFESGYTFDFIEGEMKEKSPFTLRDLLEQRERFIKGLLLAVHSPKISLKYKFLLGTFVYSLIMVPIAIIDFAPLTIFPELDYWLLHLNVLVAFVRGLTVYMFIFGLGKSWSLKELNKWEFCLSVVGNICLLPIQYIVTTISLFRAVIISKHEFFIVQK